MLLFALSDIVWQAIIGGIITIVLAWMSHRTANKVRDVETTIKTTTSENTEKLDRVVTLTNSALLESQLAAWTALAATAAHTNAEGDIAASVAAKSKYEAHKKSQDDMDKAKGTNIVAANIVVKGDTVNVHKEQGK